MTTNHSELFEDIKASSDLFKLIQDLQADPASHSKYTWRSNELRRKGKLVLGHSVALKAKVLHWLHATIQKVAKIFFNLSQS